MKFRNASITVMILALVTLACSGRPEVAQRSGGPFSPGLWLIHQEFPDLGNDAAFVSCLVTVEEVSGAWIRLATSEWTVAAAGTDEALLEKWFGRADVSDEATFDAVYAVGTCRLTSLRPAKSGGYLRVEHRSGTTSVGDALFGIPRSFLNCLAPGCLQSDGDMWLNTDLVTSAVRVRTVVAD